MAVPPPATVAAARGASRGRGDRAARAEGARARLGPAAAAAPPAKDISDLIPAQELEALSGTPSKPLFNPDAPFSVKSEPARRRRRRAPPRASRVGKPSFVRMAAIVGGLVALAGGGLFVSKYFNSAAVPAAAGAATTTGTLIVQSNPAGVQVFVDGIDRGMTPARISVTPGAHILELRGRGVPRVIPLQVAAGAQVSQYLEFADTPDDRASCRFSRSRPAPR